MESTGSTTAVEWLSAAAPDPAACRREWHRSGLGVVLLPAGQLWDVLKVPGTLGRAALAVLGQLAVGRGPVLVDPGDESLGFFVPVGTAAWWVGTGVRGAGEGTWVLVPHPARRQRGLRWLVPPDGSGALNDPVLLELALHEAAGALGGPREHR